MTYGESKWLDCDDCDLFVLCVEAFMPTCTIATLDHAMRKLRDWSARRISWGMTLCSATPLLLLTCPFSLLSLPIALWPRFESGASMPDVPGYAEHHKHYHFTLRLCR